MRKPIVCIILLLLIYTSIAFTGCTEQSYIIEIQEQADIPVINETFDCNAEECIDIINEDFVDMNLMQIPNCYTKEVITETIDHDNVQKEYEYIIYHYNISDALELALYSPNTSNEKVSAFKLVCKGSPGISNADQAKADRYFKVICNNVCPMFDINSFLEDSQTDNNIQIDNLTFYTRLFNVNNEKSTQHKERIYCVSTMYDNDIL